MREPEEFVPREHIPVLAEQVAELLAVRPGDLVIDCTLGDGGHTLVLARKNAPAGKIIGIDRDEVAVARNRKRLEPLGERFFPVRANFCELEKILADLGEGSPRAILFDLGLASSQLDDPRRGFSFQVEGPLDMRADRSQPVTAASLLNDLGEEELAQVFRNFGELSGAGRIARAIVRRRSRSPYRTAADLVSTLRKVSPGRTPSVKLYARLWQSLRIRVNQELEFLSEGLEAAWRVLAPGGRLAVISYNSLEDRIVKQFFRKLAAGEREGGEGRLMVKKPLRADFREREANPRSRSARLRVVEKLT